MNKNKEKKEKKVAKVVRNLNLKLVRPVSIREIEELNTLFKKGPQELWKYLQKKD